MSTFLWICEDQFLKRDTRTFFYEEQLFAPLEKAEVTSLFTDGFV